MDSDGRPKPGHVLVCRAGTRLCAFPLEHVVETMRSLPIESVPGAPPFVRGLAMIRGVPVPVVDAGAVLGAGDPLTLARFVSVRVGHRQLVLAVQEVLGVRELPAASLRELPPLLGEAGAGVVSAVSALDSALLLVLQAAHIVSEAEWESLGTRASS